MPTIESAHPRIRWIVEESCMGLQWIRAQAGELSTKCSSNLLIIKDRQHPLKCGWVTQDHVLRHIHHDCCSTRSFSCPLARSPVIELLPFNLDHVESCCSSKFDCSVR